MKINDKRLKKPFTMHDCKRFLIPVTLQEKCPECKTKCETDMYEEGMIEYPSINAPTPVYFYCENCDHEWDAFIEIRIKVKKA